MSNLVLNDDSIMCQDCYEESYGSDLHIQTPYETIIGTTIHFPCRCCGVGGNESNQENPTW